MKTYPAGIEFTKELDREIGLVIERLLNKYNRDDTHTIVHVETHFPSSTIMIRCGVKE